MKQTDDDRRILDVMGHKDGPRFNGQPSVRCRNYDEHRQHFVRVLGIWVCPTCREEER